MAAHKFSEKLLHNHDCSSKIHHFKRTNRQRSQVMPDCAVCLPNGHVEKSTFCGFLSQNASGLQEQHQYHHRGNVADHHPVELFAAESLAVALHLVNDVVRRHDPAAVVSVPAHH